MFGSLREYNYRLYAGGQVVSLIGTWMQRVAQDWLVLELSHGSPVALGVAAALQFGPTLLISLYAGVLADRFDKRRVLTAVQVAMGLCALALGLLDISGVVRLWQVFVLCLLLGTFSAFDAPIRQAFVIEMVGRDHVTNAVALNAMTFNLARIVGPAIAGVAINLVGTGWVFLVNAVSFVGVVAGLMLMKPGLLRRTAPVPRRRGQLREGLRYVRGRPDLMVLLTLVFCVGTFGMTFYTSLAVVARNVFGRGADAYGLLSTLLAVGTLGGSVWAARRSAGRGESRARRMRLLFGSAVVFSALEIVTGLMPTYLTLGLLLIPTGAALLTVTTTANTSVQLSVLPEMRGRVMGLYMLLFLGGTPLGGPALGWIAELWGGRAPLVVGGLISLVSALACAVLLVRVRGAASAGRAGRAGSDHVRAAAGEQA
jgi:MFS family permease